jgi:hypothetical protein
VYVLKARIRNAKAIGELVTANDEARLRRLEALNVGHDGLPVYTAHCEYSIEDAGHKMAEVVWTLDKQRRVELRSMAVVFNCPADDILLRTWKRFHANCNVSSTEFAKLTTSFYKALGTRYKENARGQQHSLIPLPLFALDIETHSDEDIQNAQERFGTWMKTLCQILERSAQSKVDRQKRWLDAVETLTLDVHTRSSPSSRSSASEKVRSILLHLLWECCIKTDSTKSEGGQGLEEEAKTLCQQFEDSSEIFDGAMSDVKALVPLLKRYRFVQFLDVDWIQGCEFDVVVTWAYTRVWRYETVVFGSLSRAKLLAIVLLPAETEKDARARWVGPWRDWSEFAGTSV